MKNKFNLSFWGAIFASLLFISCGTSKTATNSLSSSSQGNKSEKSDIEFLRKVYDGEVYSNSLSSKIKFTASSGEKNLSVAGSLKMKKDEVIRIQLTPLGLIEAGRLEFTKDYVLIMDRINKEYIKASYSDIDFLEKNGLDFYTLQALFWNCLFIPGTEKVTESSLKKFSVSQEDDDKDVIISLSFGDINYEWKIDKSSAHINSVDMNYGENTSNQTNVKCTYKDFSSLGAKTFPTNITLSLKSNLIKGSSEISMNLSLSNMDTSDDWETKTEISSKFKQVSVQDIMKRVLGL